MIVFVKPSHLRAALESLKPLMFAYSQPMLGEPLDKATGAKLNRLLGDLADTYEEAFHAYLSKGGSDE